MDKYPQLPPESAEAELFGARVRNSPLRVGDLLVTQLGTWVIVGGEPPLSKWSAAGYLWGGQHWMRLDSIVRNTQEGRLVFWEGATERYPCR